MCGVIGVIGPAQQPHWSDRAAYEAYRGLLTLQHRGQDAAGILTYDFTKRRFLQTKNLGLVATVFNQENLDSLSGDMAIGHTRYATVGSDGVEDLQPMVAPIPYGVGMVHNGNIVNYYQLADELKTKEKTQLLSDNDIEVMLQLWSKNLVSNWVGDKRDFDFDMAVNASEVLLDRVEGAFALLTMVADAGLLALRDPDGIRPLVLGRKKLNENDQYAYCVCSETLTLNFLGYEYYRDVQPGELIYISKEGELHSKQLKKSSKKSHCMFEWIYFSGAESTIDSKSVYGARLELGKVLARRVKDHISKNSISPDFVCPVPDTSRTAAIALAEETKLPYREGLIKNRYIQRSFILNEQEAREKAVELKLSPVRSEIEGKNILLVDDSVVRGTTSKKIISLLKRNGAKNVTLAITCPPLRYACYYGIDFPNSESLIANNKDEEQIAKYVGADSVIYLDEDDVKEAIGIPELCMACVNNKYPTNVESAKEFSKRRENNRKS